VAPHVEEDAVVLADQDDGPELLYRTNARVIATPYHRNSSGLLYLHEVLNATDLGLVESRLGERSVDQILVCPSRSDFSRPADPSGTFYEALVERSVPGFVASVPVEGTGYRLFAVLP